MDSAGFTNVVNVEGGTVACENAGLPMVRGAKTVSLERQVRIAAGTLVLAGAMLGWLVHPAFIGLSAFVGAGLIFPESRILAAWGCCWQEYRGTDAAMKQHRAM